MRRLLVLVALAGALLPVADAAAQGRVKVVGGTPTTVTTVPWQVFLAIGEDLGCGGSVLDATRVLTAAHCVVAAGTTTPRAVSSIKVLAGFDDVSTYQPGGTPPAGTQVAGVAGIRVHPLYEDATKTDDVAILMLAKALSLATPRTRAVALAPVGGGPVPGAGMGFSGYGAQVEGRLPDGKLYAATLTAITDDACRQNLAVNASAGVQCVAPGNQAACFGDSGGPLMAGGVQVGVASYAPLGGCGRGPSGFADLTAPEVRAFVDGAAAIPVAPRQSAPASLFSVQPPVQGSPLRCEPGTWAGAESLAYTFVDDRSGAPLQSGTSNVFVPAAAHLGAGVACVVAAGNGGGTSTARTGTATAVQPDAVPPRAVLRSARCRKRRCTVRLRAADPNSQGALRIRVTVRGKRLEVRHGKGTSYRATGKRIRRGPAKLRVRVVDAAGNRMKPDLKRRIRVR